MGWLRQSLHELDVISEKSMMEPSRQKLIVMNSWKRFSKQSITGENKEVCTLGILGSLFSSIRENTLKKRFVENVSGHKSCKRLQKGSVTPQKSPLPVSLATFST